MTFAFLLFAFVAAVNPCRQRLVMPERLAVVALGCLLALGAVACIAALGGALLEGLDISPESFRLGAALVLALEGARFLLFARPGAEPELAGLKAALVPVAFPLLLTPGVVALAVAAGGDDVEPEAVGALAIALALVLSRRTGTPRSAGGSALDGRRGASSAPSRSPRAWRSPSARFGTSSVNRRRAAALGNTRVDEGSTDGIRGAEGKAERRLGDRALPTDHRDHHRHPRRRGRPPRPRPGRRHGSTSPAEPARSPSVPRPPGRSVTGIDLAPKLIETAKERAGELGLDIDYRVGDAERLELDDASFDKVSSTCGIMFTPDHEATAGELARVTKPGGKIALANWTPTGGLAKMFAVMAPYQPAPPPSSPFAWGDEEHVRDLLGEAFELDLSEHVSTLRTASGEEYWELFSTSYGPTKTLADSLGDRREELHRDWVDFFEQNYRVDGEIVHTREYLLVLGTRR